MLAHFTGDDVSSAALVFGLAFVFMSWRAGAARRRDTLRFGALGTAALAIAAVASWLH